MKRESIFIEVTACNKCPCKKTDRYFYCSYGNMSCSDAYRKGLYWENSVEGNSICHGCPLKKLAKQFDKQSKSYSPEFQKVH